MPAPKLPTFHTFAGRSVPWLVDAQARDRGDRPYLIWEPFEGVGKAWTYAEFAEETRAYAAGLASHGIKKGEFVLLHMENCPEFLIIWHACARIGAVVVTTNAHSTSEELDYFASRSNAAVAITQPQFVPLVQGLTHGFRWIAATATNSGKLPDAPVQLDVIPIEDLRGNAQEAPIVALNPLDPGSVQFTSGTTARPKGVVWTHANALWAARMMASRFELTENDRGIVHFPLFHTNALAYSMLATLWAGGSAVLTPKFSASRFWEISVRHRCTWASMTMFPLKALLKHPDPAEHNYRLWALAGDMAVVKERWGIKTVGGFGMTETVAACIFCEPGFVGAEGSVGRPCPDYEISIRREDGSEVALDEIGRIHVRGIPGLSMFHEFLRDPAATAAAFDAEGWFDTGDEGFMRADGETFFVGRAKDMLKVGGENVASLEIETVIAAVPGVSECAVIGKPDEMREEVPVAFVVAEAPSSQLEQAIAAACRDKLSAFKRPHEIRFVEALPKGTLGKILKRQLREMIGAPEK